RSDEVQLLEEALLGVPILEGKNRYDNAKKTLKQGHVDAFVMDDGFQHRRLKRDLNIVVVDALNPWGNRQMIPRGILREPLRSLKRADVIILTKVDLAQNVLPLKQEIQRIHPQAVVCETMHHPFAVHSLRSKERLEPSFLKGRKVCAISGIGNPDSFDKTLLALEADVHKHFIFEDHHIYTQTDVERIVNYALKNGVIYVITTQKDLPKLKPFIQTFGLKLNLLVLEIQFAFITGEEQFLERVNHLFQH
ncbi:MAG: tetraacyldisaccharide 4'-kinase, partial [Candidatus Omnitrophica bacterium]|nr:tetraacyldisaccharide 4'-kinase [Candidatus Omnitrophota bacterium]